MELASRTSRCSHTTGLVSWRRPARRSSSAPPTRMASPFSRRRTTTAIEPSAMKARARIGWAVTGLMAALMLLSAVPDVLRIPDALAMFRHLGYPPYLLVFLGTAKILGVAAVLTPGVPR